VKVGLNVHYLNSFNYNSSTVDRFLECYLLFGYLEILNRPIQRSLVKFKDVYEFFSRPFSALTLGLNVHPIVYCAYFYFLLVLNFYSLNLRLINKISSTPWFKDGINRF
jgi:hypothetical protein